MDNAEKKEEKEVTHEYRLCHYQLSFWRIEKKASDSTEWETIPVDVPTFKQGVYLLFSAYMPKKGYDSADELIDCFDYVLNKINDKIEEVIIEREKR